MFEEENERVGDTPWCGTLVNGLVKAKINGIHYFLGGRAFINVGGAVVWVAAVGLWNFGALGWLFSRLFNGWKQNSFDLLPSDEGSKNMLQMREFRVGSTVVLDVLFHELVAFILRLESRHSIGKIFGSLQPFLGISMLSEDASKFWRMLFVTLFGHGDEGRYTYQGEETKLGFRLDNKSGASSVFPAQDSVICKPVEELLQRQKLVHISRNSLPR